MGSNLDDSAIDKIPKALVLGGKTGMLGQALMKAGASRGFEMISLGREDGDVLDLEFLDKQISQINPDFIFNSIAYTGVDNAEDDCVAANLVNKTLPENLARLIKGSSCHCIHYSTDFVFNGKNTIPYVETDATDPLCVYGSSKLAGEQMLGKLDNAAILRTAWLYGCGRNNFVRTIVRLAHEKPVLRVVHDQVGSPTSTADLADMSFIVASNKAKGIFNAVNSGTASWCDLASEAVSIFNLSTFIEPIATSEWPQKAVRPKYSVLSVKHFTETFAYAPRPWPQALREYLFECMDKSMLAEIGIENKGNF